MAFFGGNYNDVPVLFTSQRISPRREVIAAVPRAAQPGAVLAAPRALIAEADRPCEDRTTPPS